MKTPRKLRNARAGFTLIELMIVIVIIAILIALLVPAVSRGIRLTRITGVQNEISQLESAISKFKADHGIEPPSLIWLCETGSDWSSYPDSVAQIRQMWPQFNFAMNRDLNGDGDGGSAHEKFQLSLCECLVFFLGGMPQNSSGLYSVTGFSKDPTNPFAPVSASSSREAPLFEFQPSRLAVFGAHATSGTPFPFPAYKDNLPGQTLPYLYYSAYDGQGYAIAEFGGGALTVPYQQGPNATDPMWKPNSHQLISPGYDHQYGYGGAYLASGTTRLPVPTTAPPTGAQRAPESDNITNFGSGELQP